MLAVDLDIISLCASALLLGYSLWVLGMSIPWQRAIESASVLLQTLPTYRMYGLETMDVPGTPTVSELASLNRSGPSHQEEGQKDTVANEVFYKGLLDLWGARVSLCVLVAAWAVLEILSIRSLWVEGSGLTIHAMNKNVHGRRYMCQAYTAATLGLLEPLILLLPALMLRESMRRGAKASALFRAGSTESRSVLRTALILTAPVTVCQAVLVFVPEALRGTFTSPGMRSLFSAWDCDNVDSGGAGCLKLDCKYPLVPLVVMAAFLVVYLVGLHRVALAARRHALNAAVRARASALRWAPTVLCLLLLLVRAVYVGGFSKQTWQQQFSGGKMVGIILWAVICVTLMEVTVRRSWRELARAVKFG